MLGSGFACFAVNMDKIQRMGVKNALAMQAKKNITINSSQYVTSKSPQQRDDVRVRVRVPKYLAFNTLSRICLFPNCFCKLAFFFLLDLVTVE